MTSKALQFEQAGKSRYANISVGDKVIASYDNGSQFVTCRVYAIEEAVIKFLWGEIVFSTEIELAAMSTLLIEKFNKEAIIAEIMARLAA